MWGRGQGLDETAGTAAARVDKQPEVFSPHCARCVCDALGPLGPLGILGGIGDCA